MPHYLVHTLRPLRRDYIASSLFSYSSIMNLSSKNCPTIGLFSIRKSIIFLKSFTVFFISILYILKITFMLREGGRKRARFPLTPFGEGLPAVSMLTVESVWMESGLTPSNGAPAIGRFRVGPASLASRIIPAIVHASPLDHGRGRGVLSRLHRSRRVSENAPAVSRTFKPWRRGFAGSPPGALNLLT